MFKKRRQRSKKYTLTSFGSVDEDRFHDSQEEDGVFQGSESEIDEDGFSAAPDPTWDSDYLDMLEKRATAGTEVRGDGAENAPSPGLCDTAGKGAQLFEQQRKRAVEHAKKLEAAQPRAPPQFQVQDQAQMYQMHQEVQSQIQYNLQPQQIIPPGHATTQQELFQASGQVAVGVHVVANGDLSYSAVSAASMMMSPPPVAHKPATASVTILTSPPPPAETPLPDLPASNVLNRTARPFTPGFISIRAATAPVTFRPPITKTYQRPASAAVVPQPFSTASEQAFNVTSVSSQLSPGPPPMMSPPYSVPHGQFAPKPEGRVTFHPSTISSSVETMQSAPVPTFQQASFATMPPLSMPYIPPAPQAMMFSAPVPPVHQILGPADPITQVHPHQVPVAQSTPPLYSMAPVAQVAVVNQPEAIAPTPVPGATGRTGILLESLRRSSKIKPMFNVPEVKKNSPNPELLSMVQNLDDRFTRYRGQQPIYDAEEEDTSAEAGTDRLPPPVAPKPRVLQEAPQILNAGGKGAELFARRQSRMGMYVVDTPLKTPYQQEVTFHNASQPLDPSLNCTLPSQWKYSPNVRAPPPIGYNPLLGPTIPIGPQRDGSKPDSRGRGGSQRDGIQALDFMRRQPYQLNSAMFNYGGSVANLSAMPSYQAHRQQQGDYSTTMVGSSLTSPKQVPLKTARVYEIKRFSTPTPMSAPSLAPKVIAPRSSTTLGERLVYTGMTSPPPAPLFTRAPAAAPAPIPHPSQPVGLPNLPKFSATPVANHVPCAVPTPYTPVAYSTGLQAAKQFQSAPELSILASFAPSQVQLSSGAQTTFCCHQGGRAPPCLEARGNVRST